MTESVPQRLHCNNCGHDWLQFMDDKDWLDNTVCPECKSQDWDWIISGKGVPDLPPEAPGLKPWLKCPFCGADQDQVPADGMRLLYQKCEQCGFEEYAKE